MRAVSVVSTRLPNRHFWSFPPHLPTAIEIGGDVDRKRRLVRKASRTETHVSLLVLRVLEGERAFVLNRPGPLPTLEPAVCDRLVTSRETDATVPGNGAIRVQSVVAAGSLQGVSFGIEPL